MKATLGSKTIWLRLGAVLAIALMLLTALPVNTQAAEGTEIIEVFDVSGTWVAPPGVTSVTAEVWGGGGRGGTRSTKGVGGGGGGGAYSSKANITVTPGESYDYVAGAGADSSTEDGGDSYFLDTSTVLAKGGSTVPLNTIAGGNGGAAASGVGDVKHSGGNGFNGYSTYGGGGGSSAGTTLDGNNATNYLGAAAPSGGGNGGNGRNVGTGTGYPGQAPGGGGGGAYRNNSGTYAGGNGANGRVRLTYVLPPTTTVNDGASPTNKYSNGSDANLAVSAFTVSTNVDDTITALTITGSGTGLGNVDVNGVKLWLDDGTTANEWDGSDHLAGTTSISGSTADFSGLSLPVTTTATQYIVTFDIVASPVHNETLQARVTAFTAGNIITLNNDTNDATITIDTLAPTIGIGSPSLTLTNTGPVTFTVTYADAHFNSSTLVPGNVSLNATGTANGTISVTGLGLTRTVTVDGITGNGSLGISIAADTATDLAGNTAPAAGPSATFDVDNILPAVDSILRVDPTPTSAATVHWTVTFSEPVVNVGANDFALPKTGGIAGESVTGVTGSGAGPYTVTVNTGTGNGTLGLDIAATPSIQDNAGNALPTGATGPLYTLERDLTITGSLGATGAGATVYCYASRGTCPASVVANGSGVYTITVTPGGTPLSFSGIIEPIPPINYYFSPTIRTYTTILADQTGQNYTAHAITHTTYYVDNRDLGVCSDTTGGTLAHPFCTLGKADDVAVAGDTVRVLGGTYAETVRPNSGNPDDPVTFIASPGVTVTGNGSSSNGGAFRLYQKHDIVIDGFTITNTADYGIYAYDSTRLTIRNNHVSYAGTRALVKVGIYLNSTTYSTISGNTTAHNTFHGIELIAYSTNNIVSNNTSFANATETESRAIGITLETNSTNNTVIHNITYANEDSGINCYGDSGYNDILGNLSFANGDHGIDNNNSPYNRIVGNTVQGNVTSGINLEGTVGSDHGTVKNNVVSNNGLLRTVGGGHLGTPPGNIRVDTQSDEGTVLDYNLYYLDYSQTDAHYTLVFNGFNYVDLEEFTTAVPTQEQHGLGNDATGGNATDPSFIDFVFESAPAERPTGDSYEVAIPSPMGDFHIQSDSKAIDSASSDSPEPAQDLDGYNRVDDELTPNTGDPSPLNYYDRGAYEYQSYKLTLASSANPSTFGDSVTFTATLNQSAAGTVTFKDGTTEIGTDDLDNGSPNIAMISTSTLTAGTHSITAEFEYSAGKTAVSPVLLQVVNPKLITITPADNQSKIYGEVDPTYTYTPSETPPGGFTGALSHDPGENVGVYPFNLGTLSAGTNYTLSLVPGHTFEIKVKPITVTPDLNQSKIYGEVDPAFTYTYTPALVNGDTFSGALGRAGGVNVGFYAFNLGTLSAGSNYSLILTPGRSFEIQVKPLTVTPDDGQSKIYGDADPVYTYTNSPALVAGDAFTGALGRDPGEAVGTYAFTLGTLSAGTNYNLTLASGHTFEIQQKPITITPDSGQSKIYGEVNPVYTYTNSPALVAGDSLSGALGRDPGEDVDAYPFTLGTLNAGPNYSLTLASGRTFAILQKPITITPDDGQSKTYGDADPVYTYTYSPELVLGDSFSGFLGRDPGEAVGTYPFTLGSLSAGSNYALSLDPGHTFEIQQKSITVTPDDNQSKVYLTSDPVFTYTYSPELVAGDDFTGALGRFPGESIGSYAFNLGTLSAGPNYNLALDPGHMFGITARPVTVTADSGQSKVYGTVDPVFTYTSSDPEAVFTGALSRYAGEDVGDYPILQGTLSADITYSITFISADFSITKADQTITFNSLVDKALNAPDFNVTATASSLLTVTFSADTPLVCSVSPAGLVHLIAEGTCTVNADQDGNGNYNAAPQVQQSFGVGKAGQTISFNSAAPSGAVVGGPTYTPVATATSGLPVTFTIDSSSSAVCSISTGVVSFTGIGTCTINANQPGNGTYNAAPQVQQSFGVSKGPQTISFTSTPPLDAKVGGHYTPTATATSGLPVTFTIDPSSASVCSISSGVVTFNAQGTCRINANQAGNDLYNEAPQVQQSVTVALFKILLPLILR